MIEQPKHMKKDARERMMKCKLMQPNTILFVGFVISIIEPHLRVINGMNKIIRMIVISDKREKDPSSVAIQIPDSFSIEKIEWLASNRVLTEFSLNCVAKRTSSVYANIISCIAIRPIDQRSNFRKYNQILETRGLHDSTCTVDSNGYKFPYTY